MLLASTALATWRAYRRVSRRRLELSTYASQQVIEIQQLTAQLNQHGFELEHTAAELGPRVERIMAFLEQPLIGATLPWLLRRLLSRPYRRR